MWSYCLFLFVASLLFPPIVYSQNLTAIYTQSKLPSGRYKTAVAYDGDDIIYIFGGYGESTFPLRDIIRFNITSDTYLVVGGVEAYQTTGLLKWDNDPNRLLFFAGEPSSAYRFETNSSSFYLWQRLPYHFADGTSVKYNSSIYFFGGFNTLERNRIVEYNPDTGSHKILGRLPMQFYDVQSALIGSRVFLIGSPVETDKAFINHLMVYDLETGNSIDGPPNFPTSPYNQDNTVVTDGNDIYLVGPMNEYKSNGLIKINPDTLEHEFVYVDNWPLTDSDIFQWAPDPVYVKKLNRIFFFGGNPVFNNNPPIDSIWYIQL